jgi:hypothetical protein
MYVRILEKDLLGLLRTLGEEVLRIIPLVLGDKGGEKCLRLK